MDSPSQTAPYEKTIEFLLAILEAEEKRRDSVENKSSVLMAANAILLSAIIGLGLPLITAGSPFLWFQIPLTIVALGAVIASVLYSAEILVSFLTQEQRLKVMDLGSDPNAEYNLFWFIGIAKFKKEDYQREINGLTEQKIFEQLVSQIHNLSRLLRRRYEILRVSHSAFIVGTTAFAILALTKIFIR